MHQSWIEYVYYAYSAELWIECLILFVEMEGQVEQLMDTHL